MLNVNKLADTLADIVGEKHRIRVKAEVRPKGKILYDKGVVEND